MMLLGGVLAGETQLGKGLGEAPGPALCRRVGYQGRHTGQRGRLTSPILHCHMSLQKRGLVRQEEGVTQERVMESRALSLHVQES